MRVDDIPIVCISLERRPDRWQAVQSAATAAGIQVERLPAVDAKTFDAARHPSVSLGTAHNITFHTRRSHYEIDAPGAVGASLSHFKAWEKIRSSGAPAMIIFEDDVNIPVDFRVRLEQIVAALPAVWDMVQFQRTTYDGVSDCKPVKGKDPWQACTSLMGAYAYMISPRGAEKLLARAFPIELHVDAYIAYMSRLGHITMLWHPLIDIEPSDMGSDIDHGNSNICSVPTDMTKHGVVALQLQSVMGLMGICAVAGGMLALAYWKPR